MKLYEPFPDHITVDGQEFRLTLYFDRVLRFLSLLEDKSCTAEEVTEAGFSWLVDCRRNIPIDMQNRVLQRVVADIITPKRRRLNSRRPQQKCVDYDFDAAEIYASFWQAYGIDLVRQQGKLHWCAFQALFDGLPDDTPIRRIMRIRTEEMPPLTRSNAKQIQSLTELKTLYRLPDTGGNSDSGAGWDGLFNMMLAKAKE